MSMVPLVERVLLHASTQGDKPAFSLAAKTLTFAELAEQMMGCAAQFAAVPQRDPLVAFDPRYAGRVVAISLRNSVAFPPVFLGAIASGSIVAVLDPAWVEPQAVAALALLDPEVLVTDSPQVAALAQSDRCAVLPPGSSSGSFELLGESAPWLVGFTSGTTATPKAYIRSLDSWQSSLDTSAELLGATADAVSLVPGPLAHGLSLYALVESLHSGGHFVSMEQFGASEAIVAIEERRVSRIVGVPTMFRSIAAAESESEVESVRVLVSGGSKIDEPVQRELARVMPAAALIEYYGASELSFVSVRAVGSAHVDAVSCVGRAFPGVELEVRDADGNPVEEGEPGTVFVRSELVSEGYLGDSDSAGFRRSGDWCSVGDVGLLRDGQLHLLGREGDMIISGGLNIYPSEIEATMRQYGFAEVAVFDLADERLGRRLVAAVPEVDAVNLDTADLQSFLERLLPRYKVPRELYAVSAWPLTQSGKISKGALGARIEGSQDGQRRLEW